MGSTFISTTLATITPGPRIITVSGTVYESTMSFYAPMFQLNYKSSDIQSSINSPSPTLSTSLTIPTTTNTGSTDTGSVEHRGNSNGLSVGAKAGIGIGGAVGTLVMVGMVVGFFWKRRRRVRAHHIRPETVTAQRNETPRGQTMASKDKPTPERAELDNNQVPSELPS